MGSGSSRALTGTNNLVSAITNPAQSGGVQRSIWNREAYVVVKTRKEFLELSKVEPQFAQAVSASISAYGASGAANNSPADGPLASFALSLLFYNPKSEQKININDKPRSYINFGDLQRFFPKELSQTNSATSAPEAQPVDFVATVSERLANAVERVSSRTFEPLIDDPATYKGNAGFLPAIEVAEASPARSLKELLKSVDLKALILPAALTFGVAASLAQLRSFVRA